MGLVDVDNNHRCCFVCIQSNLSRLTLRQLDFEVKIYDDLQFRDMVRIPVVPLLMWKPLSGYQMLKLIDQK